MVIGDSVTFGDGVPFEETWTYLFEQRLKQWRPQTDWQVWNLGVPGYDTARELTVLEELGPLYKPDLVIVGMYENDIYAWDPQEGANKSPLLIHAKAFLKKNFYLYTKVREAYQILKYKNHPSVGFIPAERESDFLARPKKVADKYNLAQIELKHDKPTSKHPPRASMEYLPDPELFRRWKSAVESFKQYEKDGIYKILFFINIAPDVSWDDNLFKDGIHNAMNDFFLEHMGGGPVPTVSTYDAFWNYRPSEMPLAWGHSLGPANVVKADVLFKKVQEILKPKSLAARGNEQ